MEAASIPRLRLAKRSCMSNEEYADTHDTRVALEAMVQPWAWAKLSLEDADEAVRREHKSAGSGLLFLCDKAGWFNRDAIGRARRQSAVRSPRRG
jgi:hypothetical protein